MANTQSSEIEAYNPTIEELKDQLTNWENKLLKLMSDQSQDTVKIQKRTDARENIKDLQKKIANLKSERQQKGLEREQYQVLYDNQSIISTSLSIRKEPISLKKQNELQQIQKGR
ncbi:hypothetical protein BH23BAC1_BH23BAC1_05110 [soil metagenome]